MMQAFERDHRAVVAIYGSGGCGRALSHSLVASCRPPAAADGAEVQVIFVDDRGGANAPLPVARFEDLQPGDRFVIGVSDGRTRGHLEQRCLGAGLVPHDFFAPGFEQGFDNMIEPGAVFMSKTMVTTNVRIGRQFQCNIYSYVEHDCVIGDFVTFAPRVSCNGNIHIGDFAYIGAGAVIKQGTPDRPLVIGEGAVVGMGAVVTKNVPAGVVVVGNPARAHHPHNLRPVDQRSR
jgi:sugar O-acyltransferase (sialic acid O-acetyltransferase NeuD family)